MENEIYNILKKHKLPLKKREEVLADLLLLFGVSSSFQGYCKEETLNGKRCKDICDKPQCGW